MKYAVWFLRLLFVAWMFPAGVNHFVPLFPQPLGNQPLSRELFAALADSGLFDLVKAVELFAGVCLLLGLYVPLGLLLCMPISVCVWYWDVPLQGWASLSAWYGWAVLLTNALLCLAYIGSYRAMFTIRFGRGPNTSQLAFAGRLVFGGWMLAIGLNQFLLPFIVPPAGHASLAVQLMAALDHSGLLDVAMAVLLVMGALILAGTLLPVALTITMPICVCAAYWAVVLEREPVIAAITLAAVALNAMLILAHFDDYRPMLARRVLAVGEAGEGGNRYEARYVWPAGRTSRTAFAAALVPLIVVALCYYRLVWGPTGRWCLLVLMFPAVVLHARRLHDTGRRGWWLLVPAVPVAAAVWFGMFDRAAEIGPSVALVALAAGAGVTLWGLVGRSAGRST